MGHHQHIDTQQQSTSDHGQERTVITKTMSNTENRPNNSEQVRMHSPDDNKTQLFFCVAENGFGRGIMIIKGFVK